MFEIFIFKILSPSTVILSSFPPPCFQLLSFFTRMEDKIMKKNLKICFLTAMTAFLLSGCSGQQAPSESPSDGQSYTIGIGQFAAHGSLDNCREGFLLGLAQEGLVEGENLTVLYENAQADGGIASQIITNFASQKVDLICGIATPMAQTAYGVGKKQNIPVIYTAVTDPVAAELAGSDGVPVGEITGTSDKLPVIQQLQMIRTLLPDAKTIGILFTTSEVNSLSTIEEYKASASEYGFEIVDMGISTTADVPLAADALLEKVDCITNLTDNTVVASLPVILDKAAKKNIPVFGSEIEQVKIGCLAAMGLDYVDLGKQTGKMAAAVLKGEKKASEMNFQIIEEAAFYGNTKVAKDLGITIPEELISSAKELFTED
jgi:putative ABC transport system substrate-binding protein